MAVRWAVANGNWSNAATWSGSIIPTSADNVYPNNFTVTVDQNITVLNLNNGNPGIVNGPVAGGTFALANGIVVTVTSTPGLNPSAGTLTRITGSDTATIIGIIGPGLSGTTLLISQSANAIISGSIQGNGSTGANAITHASSGTLTITGSVRGSSGTNAHGITNSSSGSIYITGSVTGGTATTAYGINNSGGGSSTTIMGNVSSGTGASSLGIAQFGANSTLQVTGSVIANTTAGIQANSGANVSIYVSGSVIGGPTNIIGAIFKTTTGVLQVIGPITAGLNCPAIETNTNVTSLFLTGPFYNINNRNALNVPMFQLISGSTPTWTFDTETFGEQRTLYTADSPGNFPSASNVRQGTVFGNTGQFTGTVAIPVASNVLKGVLLDNTTGSASFTTQNVWSILTSSLNVTESIGERLQNASTVATDGILITSKGTL